MTRLPREKLVEALRDILAGKNVAIDPSGIQAAIAQIEEDGWELARALSVEAGLRELLEALRSRCEELEKDAGRYKHVCKHGFPHRYRKDDGDIHWTYDYVDYFDTAHEAIDRAMKQDESKNQERAED